MPGEAGASRRSNMTILMIYLAVLATCLALMVGAHKVSERAE